MNFANKFETKPHVHPLMSNTKDISSLNNLHFQLY